MWNAIEVIQSHFPSLPTKTADGQDLNGGNLNLPHTPSVLCEVLPEDKFWGTEFWGTQKLATLLFYFGCSVERYCPIANFGGPHPLWTNTAIIMFL